MAGAGPSLTISASVADKTQHPCDHGNGVDGSAALLDNASLPYNTIKAQQPTHSPGDRDHGKVLACSAIEEERTFMRPPDDKSV
jgi:hypothetical protein